MSAPALLASGTQTATVSTEHTLYTSAAGGTFILEVDLSAMLSGDTVKLRLKGKTLSGGSVKTKYVETYFDAPAEADAIARSIPLPDDLAVAFTLEQSAGTSRSYPWKVLSL